MPRRDLNIAVVGAGLIGKTHVDRVNEAAVLQAIVDPADDAQAIAARLETQWFADLSDCLAVTRPDGIIVASPNALHLEQGEACLNAGVPALIEKPLADSVASAKRLAGLSVETGVPILVGHHRRHSPVIHAAKTSIEEGRLGRIVAVNAMFWLNKPPDYFDMKWRTEPGGGPTYINLIHDIDLMQYLCGPIAAVQAREANYVRNFAVEDTSAILLTFANGALGTVNVSDTVSSPWSWELTAGENPVYPKTDQSCYMIGGTEGSLSLPDLRVWSHTGAQSWWSPMECDPIAIQPQDPVAAQFQHFLDVIEGTAKPLVSAGDGLRNIVVLEAIKDAARTGGEVRIR